MANSKANFRPIFPMDLHNNVRVGQAATGSNFAAGTLVCRVSGLLVACDTDVLAHQTLPAEIVWEDGTSRFDLDRYQLDGTQIQEYTTCVKSLIAEVAAGRFTSTPVAGDVIAKSATAGLMDPLTGAELATLLAAPEDITHVIGRVVGPGETNPALWLCHFDLG